MGVTTFQDLAAHVGHRIKCVGYGWSGKPPYWNVALECTRCNIVLLDIDVPEPDEEAGEAKE